MEEMGSDRSRSVDVRLDMRTSKKEAETTTFLKIIKLRRENRRLDGSQRR